MCFQSDALLRCMVCGLEVALAHVIEEFRSQLELPENYQYVHYYDMPRKLNKFVETYFKIGNYHREYELYRIPKDVLQENQKKLRNLLFLIVNSLILT